jgi:hypothetical protein
MEIVAVITFYLPLHSLTSLYYTGSAHAELIYEVSQFKMWYISFDANVSTGLALIS